MYLEKNQHRLKNKEGIKDVLQTEHDDHGTFKSYELQSKKLELYKTFISASDIGAWEYLMPD
jgi:hypothetical protein